ncbi:MAG: NAD-binding protein, partial [Verrucomicrobia bacterium]|nr:NAD-binding protein [Verrucomicrobiota bacterium]
MAHTTNDHLRSPRLQWWLVVLSGALTLVCGTIGVAQYEREHLGHVHGLSPLYHAAQMLILHLPHFDGGLNLWIELGRWFGVLTFFGAALILLWWRFRREIMLLRVGTWSDHWLICGLGRKGFELARHLKRRDQAARVVVLDPNPDAQLADQCLEQGIGVVSGDAAVPAALEQAGAARAGEIIVITPSDETNVRVATEIRIVQSAAKRGPATCHVHLSDIHLREALQRLTETDRLNPGACEFHFFDVFDDEARRVLLQLPLDGSGLREDDRRSVHVAILGFGRMGRSIALRAAKMGHFANGKPLRLSIVDRAAELQRERFLFRYPAFAEGRICLTEFRAAEVESQSTRRWLEQAAGEPDTLLHVFVCLSEDARTL